MPTITPNPRFVFAKRPGDGFPVVGEHIVFEPSRTIDLDAVLLNGGFLTKTLLISPEPFMRERMRDPSIPSYTTTSIVGAPLIGNGLVIVLRSEMDGVKVGDYMFGMTPWEAYSVQPYIEGRVEFKAEDWPPFTFDMDSLSLHPVPNPGGAFPWTRFCSVLGTPGLTAYVGFEEFAEAKQGDTIFVSSGASGVGSMVIQLAKAKGLKIIASAGTDAKVEYMRSLGADVPFNYKTSSYAAVLSEHGPIDVYWDNVGGEALDAALMSAGYRARFVLCGSASEYNLPVEKWHGVKNTNLMFKKRLIVRGLLVPDLVPKYAEKFFSEIPALLAQGKIKGLEHITNGIENAGQVLVDCLKEGGGGVGKPVVLVAEP